MFKLECEDERSSARIGKLYTEHGVVETPCFLPVATKASVKTLSIAELEELGVEALISNAFLLYLKPGLEVIEKCNGLHNFMGFGKTIFTDSGGFQVVRKDFEPRVSKRGITLRSPFDNSRHLLTPEKCMEIQNTLSSDVAMVLDECPPYGLEYEYYVKAVKRTLDWAEKCKKAHKNEKQLLFAIVQGGVYQDLRKLCTEKLIKLEFDGYGIGGLSLGEPREKMLEVLTKSVELLPKDKPRYLMGVGSPEEIIKCVSLGIDIFDSSFPTRNARHGTIYTKKGKYNITKGRFKDDFTPLEEGCRCFTCRNYTKAYVHHLFKVKEMLGMRLATIHNLSYIHDLMAKIKRAIRNNEELENFLT